jgi:hypothetical protein
METSLPNQIRGPSSVDINMSTSMTMQSTLYLLMFILSFIPMLTLLLTLIANSQETFGKRLFAFLMMCDWLELVSVLVALLVAPSLSFHHQLPLRISPDSSGRNRTLASDPFRDPLDPRPT